LCPPKSYDVEGAVKADENSARVVCDRYDAIFARGASGFPIPVD